MNIRRAVAEDCEALTALALRAKAHWGYTANQLEKWRPLLTISRVTLAARPTFVGEVDGILVGFYSLAPGSGPWQLDDLWVGPEHMRRSIGRGLFLHAWETAVAGGASCLLIDADPNAEEFYIACGAMRIGEVPAPIEGHADRVRPQLKLQRPR
jgi:ribosomal protein S18 acetylase RimI-like enzyme